MYFNLLSLSIHSFPSLPLSLSSNKSTIYTSTHTHTHTHTHYASYNLLLPFIPSILLLLYCFLSPFSIPLVIYSIPPPLSPPPTMILGAPISFHIYISSICPPHLTLFLLLLLLPFTVDRMVLIPPLRGLLPSCFNSSHSLSFVPSLPPRTSFPHHLQPFTFSLPLLLLLLPNHLREVSFCIFSILERLAPLFSFPLPPLPVWLCSCSDSFLLLYSTYIILLPPSLPFPPPSLLLATFYCPLPLPLPLPPCPLLIPPFASCFSLSFLAFFLSSGLPPVLSLSLSLFLLLFPPSPSCT